MSKYNHEFISAWRFRKTSQSGRTLAVEASSDRGRVVFSEAFRQLHRKAQVFSLDDAGSARTRLTHSLEVAQIGRYLTQKFFEIADKKTLADLNILETGDIVQSFVETACLVHDIGNPPFGHFGELAIRHWFEKNMEDLERAWCEKSVKRKNELSPLMNDFTCFDGNPQGFRILTKLMWGLDQHSLNLTATQLASTIKYNVDPCSIELNDPIKKKPGYFKSEQSIAEEVFKQVGIPKGSRHPFVYLMEAADDIAYCMSDIEDAIAKGLLSEADFLDKVSEKINHDKELETFSNFVPKRTNGGYALGSYLLFRIKCINKIVELAALEFSKGHKEYFEGNKTPIIDNIPAAKSLLDHIKSVAQSRIYNSAVVLRNELIGAKVITGILDAFLPVLLAKEDRFNSMRNGDHTDASGNHISVEKALLRQIPNNLFLVYDNDRKTSKNNNELIEHCARAHLVIDFLSGLTDGQAVEVHRLICGA